MPDPTVEQSKSQKNSAAEGVYEFHNTMQFFQTSAEILKKYFQILDQVVKKQEGAKNEEIDFDPSKTYQAITQLITNVFANPHKSIALQKQYADNSIKIANYILAKMGGSSPPPPYEPDARDRRFRYEAWYTNIHFDFLKQTYLMNAEWLNELLDQADGADEKAKRLAKFFTKQIIDAVAPTNFLFTNPQALQESAKTNASSLVSGLNNFLTDLKKSGDIFDITRTDFSAFHIGDNIACTPGQVVYRNEMMELIYYTPVQKEVCDVPLLIVPPWINRYYILDLSQKNSFVKWVVSQGLSVFLISWVNPKEDLKDKGLEHYAKEGVLTAINFILERFNKKKVNILAYCVGGTLTAMLLAYLATHKKENIVHTASFLTTLLDFSDAGEVSVFIDEEQVDKLDALMEKTGYFDGKLMGLAFSLLRANDMIWFFVINNYLMGKSPLPFDLLYWNAHSTRLPAKMHSFYLRNMYLENNLIKPNKVLIDKTPLDLTKIKTPCHFIATHEDHIAPWESVYRATQILTCPCEFTLAGSGHVAGIINPAGSQKYGYWTNENKTFPKDPEKWLGNSKETTGSWWAHWTKWLTKRSGKKISVAAQNKIAKSLEIEKAPGSYVKVL